MSTNRSPVGTTVRDYTAADRDAVLILWRTVFHATFPDLDAPPTDEDFRIYFDDVILPTQRLWVAESRVVVGFLSASHDEILNLFVSSTHQRSGIGTLLLQTALRAQPAIRRLSTIAANVAARRFYEKNGFVFLRTQPHTFIGQQAAIYHLPTPPETASTIPPIANPPRSV